MVARENPSDGVVRTASGLIVPKGAVEARPTTPAKRETRRTAYDTDGRRRIVMLRRERAAVQAAVDILNRAGVGLILGCSDRFDGQKPCGGFLTAERDGVDEGFGCQCSRIHFLQVD